MVVWISFIGIVRGFYNERNIIWGIRSEMKFEFRVKRFEFEKMIWRICIVSGFHNVTKMICVGKLKKEEMISFWKDDLRKLR